jgi:hypothetical protein
MRHRSGTAIGQWCRERTAFALLLSRGARGLVTFVTFVTFVTLTGAAAACRASEEGAEARRATTSPSRSQSASASTSSSAPAGTVGAKPVCPATGMWQMCSVIERLERAGLAPRREEGVARELPLTQAGVAITLGRSELRVFFYPDRAARERDQARLDRAKYVSAAEPLSMQAEPTLIASENLLAILRSRSDHQRERVSDALTAGPPQPPGTKS